MKAFRVPQLIFFGLYVLSAAGILLALPWGQTAQTSMVATRQVFQSGPYNQPRGITMTAAGNLLITDFRNYRIAHITPAGRILESWGERGDLPGQFNDPTCAAMDTAGNLYVADTWNHRIQRRAAAGAWNARWGQYDQFFAPRGIAVDRHNRVYVANTSNHAIVVLNPDGTHCATWENGLRDPIGITVGPQGNIYVADTGNQRIVILSPAGDTLQTIPVKAWPAQGFHEAYLAIDQQRNIYVTNPRKNRIHIFHPDRRGSLAFGQLGDGPDQFNQPTGIAVDADGFLYISDTSNHRMVKYAPIAVTIPDSAPTRKFSLPLLLLSCAILSLTLCTQGAWLLRGHTSARAGRSAYQRLWRRWLRRPFKKQTPSRQSPRLLYFFCASMATLSALIAFAFQRPSLGAAALLIAVILFVLFERSASSSAALPKPQQTFSRRQVWWSLLLIAGLAFGLRIVRLDSVPWGINNDAAWNGMFALRILDGEPLTVFTPEAWGKETFYMYLIAFSFKLFGVSKFTLYLPGILSGTLTAALLFLLTRRVFDDRLALVSGLIYAAMAWNLTFARTGYRCILSPLFLVATVYFYVLAIEAQARPRKFLYFLLSGAAIGLGLYTYFAFRGVPLLMILFGLFTWVTTPHFMRRNGLGLLAFMLAAIALFAPLGWYGWTHPEVFMGRSNFLFIGNKIAQAGSLQPLWENLSTNLLTLFYQAKVGNFFNNDLPIISHILAYFIVGGFALHLRHFRRRGSVFALLVFAFGFLPAVLSAPDAARSFLAPVALAIFGASGLLQAVDLLARWRRPSRKTLVATGIAAIMLAEAHFYFGVLGNDAGAQFGYARKHTLIGYQARALAKTHQVYISQGHFLDTPKFLCYNLPGDVFGITGGKVLHYVSAERLLSNLRAILEAPVPDGKGLAFIFENAPENRPLLQKVQRRYPEGILTEHTDFRYGKAVIFSTYVIPGST